MTLCDDGHCTVLGCGDGPLPVSLLSQCLCQSESASFNSSCPVCISACFSSVSPADDVSSVLNVPSPGQLRFARGKLEVPASFQPSYSSSDLCPLFPLPLPLPPRSTRSSSRRVRHRFAWARRVWSLECRTIAALNKWWSSASEGGRRRYRRSRSLSWRRKLDEVVRRVHGRVQEFCRGLSTSGGSDEQCDAELAVSSEIFYGVGGGGSVVSPGTPLVPLRRDNISVPPVDAVRVDLMSLLRPEVVEELQEVGTVRTMGPTLPHSSAGDPTRLFGVEKGEYAAIIRLLVERKVVELCDTPAEVIHDIFGVPKQDMARLIFNGVHVNSMCNVPPSPNLPLIESLVKLVVPEGERLRVALIDLADYYHTLVLPEWLRQLMGLVEVEIDGKMVFPRWVTLPMGFSWAVYLAQLAHVTLLQDKCAAFRHSVSLAGPAIPRFLRPGVVGSGIYIDDVLALACGVKEANDFLDAMHAVEVCEVKERKKQYAGVGVAVKAWGILVDEHGCLRAPYDSISQLIRQTTPLLAPSVRIRPRALQSIVGKWLWFCLLVRPCLSAFTPLFRQARSHRAFISLWPSTRAVLADLTALAPLLVVDPSRPLGLMVATDASDRGGGVVIGETLSARSLQTLTPWVYYKGRSDLGSPSYQEGLGACLGELDFAGFAWKWQNPSEHITIKEGRALFTGMRRAILRSNTASLNRRHLYFVDNTGVVGAFTRGRSTNATLNSLIRRTAALEMATGATHDLIWVPTRFQPADRASRVH